MAHLVFSDNVDGLWQRIDRTTWRVLRRPAIIGARLRNSLHDEPMLRTASDWLAALPTFSDRPVRDELYTMSHHDREATLAAMKAWAQTVGIDIGLPVEKA